MEVSGRESVENDISIVRPGGYEGVNDYFCCGAGEGRAEMGDVVEMMLLMWGLKERVESIMIPIYEVMHWKRG